LLRARCGSAGKDDPALAYFDKGGSPIRSALNFAAFVVIVTASFCFVPAALAQQLPIQQTPAQPGIVQQSPQATTGTITGTITDKDGNPISGAKLTLVQGTPPSREEAASDDEGRFTFANVTPGSFQITVSALPFADQTVSGVVAAGQMYIVPPITLVLATVNTTITVEPTAVIAEREIKVEEKQRVLGVFPNFYVSYVANAAPLNPKQKSELAWKDAVDPVTFVLIGAIAGMQQATNQFPGYGQGAAGYGDRYGASYADFASGAIFGSVIFPAIFRQDPRYFYKSTGSKKSRILYAIANAVICKGDNGHWQPNYSSVLGNLASGGLANTYYPPQNRNGVALTFEVTAVGIAATAGDNLLQQFLIPKLSGKSRKHEPAQANASP